MTPANRQRYVMLQRKRADEALADAESLLGAGRHRATLSRAYYAMFHGAQAVLATEDLFRRRHTGVHAAFGECFVAAGAIPVEARGWLAAGFEERQWADYDPEGEPEPEQAVAALARARAFLAAIDRYLAAWRAGQTATGRD